MVSAVGSACSTLVYTPYNWLSAKVRRIAEAIFSYLARIITFQMGEMHKPLANRIIRGFQIVNSDPREQTPFDPKRLQNSIDLLTAYGGQEVFLSPEGATVHAMTFKSKDFYKALEARGITPVNGTLPVTRELEKFGFVKINHPTLGERLQLPKPCSFRYPPHILQCHSPGRSMGMDRKVIGMHLAAGYDITVWDPRGTANSKGTPSEGGFYLDAEAVYNHVLSQGVEPKRLYVSGFCKGAAIAAHLKRKYHDQGVHLIASNPFTSMKEVFEGYGLIGRLGIRYGIAAIQDRNLTVEQDYFDNEKKLRDLSFFGGHCVFIHTDTDKMMPAGTVDRLKAAFNRPALTEEILRKHPNPKVNGHMQPPYEDPKVWEKYVEVVI